MYVSVIYVFQLVLINMTAPITTYCHMGYDVCLSYIALSELAGRKVTIITGGIIFTTGGAVQTASVYVW